MSGEGARLIVVDDEPQIRGMIVDYLGRSGYAAHGCASGAELDVALASQPADLVVLDVSMPGEDGVSIARRLSATGATAIIMLTVLDDVIDKIVGFEVGVDDYLTKPFDLRELRARIRAVLKRVRTLSGDQAVPSTADIERLRRFPFGRLDLDIDARCLVDRDGARHTLTAMEFDLLAAFARSPNRVMSRDHLLQTAHNRAEGPFDRAIDIRIARLRKRIEVDASKPQVIKTVHGVGYIYVPPGG